MITRRAALPAAIRRALTERAAGQCERCNRSGALSVHHKNPVRNGGGDSISNLEMLCRECHRAADRETPNFPHVNTPGREPGKYKEFPHQKLVRMREDDVERLELEAAAQGLSEAEVIRLALERAAAEGDAIRAEVASLPETELDAVRLALTRKLLVRGGKDAELARRASVFAVYQPGEASAGSWHDREFFRDYTRLRAVAGRMWRLGMPLQPVEV